MSDNNKKNKIHFLHIGKTGGTALGSVFRKHPSTEKYDITVHPHQFFMGDVPVGEKAIFSVRDPLSRFVSSFYSRQRKGRPRYNLEWTEDEALAFSRFPTPNALALAFAKREGPEYKQAEHAFQNIRHVNTSYYMWFNGVEQLVSRADDILFIGQQETLNEDFKKMKAIIGLPEEAELPIDDVEAHRNPADVDRHLDDASIEVMKEILKDEFIFVDACKKLIRDNKVNVLSTEGVEA